MTPNDEHMMEVLLVAAQRDMIAAAVERGRGRGPASSQQIDVTSFAIVRALMGDTPSVLPDEDEEAGEATGVIHISSGSPTSPSSRRASRASRASRRSRATSSRQAIANVLNLTFDEAEDLKIRVGLPDIDSTSMPRPPPGIDPQVAQVAQDALEREVNKFIAEVRRSLDYYLTQATQIRTIKRILLTGSGAQLAQPGGLPREGPAGRGRARRPARRGCRSRRRRPGDRACRPHGLRARDRAGDGGCAQ